MLLARDGDLSVAIEALRSAVALHPDLADYRGLLASTYARANRPDLAAIELREGTRRAPDDVRYWHNLGLMLV